MSGSWFGLDLRAFSFSRALCRGICHEIRDLIVAHSVQPFMALTRVIAGTLMVKLQVADGLRHPQLLNKRGESVGGELCRVSSFLDRRGRHQKPSSDTVG